ncbi:MAG: hypothetical protein ISS43_00415 [Candidatus Omnitrophica bacterium]|nr:hypothetical protein [Candidatus Omnitrophota bacterium]
MVAFVKFLGIFIVGFGVAYFVNPSMIKQYMDFWKTRKRLYLGGALALLIGIVFLLAASQCRWRGFIVAFGILSLAKGICLLVISPEKVISFMNWWIKKPITFFRVHAVFAVILGVLLIYSA